MEEEEEVRLCGKPWLYRGEGGANLVLSLPEEKTVVRFAKSKYAGKDMDAKIRAIAAFANGPMAPLLGAAFVRPLRIGVCHFDSVRSEVQPSRPPRRRRKDVFSKKAILSHDCAFLTAEYEAGTDGDTVSFEIKPKQGWHDDDQRGADLCQRCLKQWAKKR